MKTSVENKIVIGFVATVLALVGIGWFSYRTTTNLVGEENWVNHTYKVIATLETGRAILTDAETAQRGYLLTGDDSFLKDCTNAQAQVNGWLGKLRDTISDNPEQLQRLDNLQPLISQRLAILNDRIKLRQEQGLQTAVAAVSARTGKDLMDQIQQGISGMHDAESRLADRRLKDAQASTAVAEAVIIGGSLFACAAGLAAILFIHRDLKLREQVERALQESRAQMQSILDNMPAIIFLKDLEGRYLFVNRQFLKIDGLSNEAVIGRTIFEITPKEHAEIAHSHHQTVLATQSPLEIEETVMHSDGPHTYFAVKFPIRDTAGKIYATGGISTDITERKRIEQLLAHERHLLNELMDHATEDIYFKDREGRFLRVNLYHARRFGIASPAEAVGKSDFDFFSEDHAQQALEDEQEVMRTGNAVVKEEKETWPDGHTTWAATIKLPLRDEARNIIGTFGLSRDITKSKEAEEEIKRQKAELETTNKELEAFSYSVSHDLRAPLRHVDGFVDLLRKQSAEKLDERGRRYLDVIATAARQMGMLIDDLLVFSKMSRMDMRRATVSSESLLHEVRDALNGEVRGPVLWKVGSLPQVEGDASMLRQVWVNLIGNAVKYSRTRNPAEIEVGCTDSGNGEFVFFVRDNGVGFDMQYVEKLFGVFQRLHRADEFEGTGIGLANVRRIVSRHGGRTWAEGKVDGGATFFFSLPKTQTQTKG